MNLRDAQAMADEVRSAISPLCLHTDDGHVLCCVAGSVRREKSDMIKDIEVVFVPDNSKLFEVAEIVNKRWGEPSIGKFPSKYTRIRGRHNIDLFCCTRDTFGLNYFIRTGPDSFCKRALSAWKKLTAGGYSEDAQLRMPDGTIVPTPTELAVFRALKWEYVRPQLRI